MTPEERQMVHDLFERLAQLEREPRDADAERLMREGLTRAPNAVYALVQTVLLQDEGLRAADARIAELEDELARAQPQQSSGSFLGNRRESGGSKWNTGAVLGGGAAAPAGSVPSVGGRGEPMGAPPGYGNDRGYPGGPSYGEPPGGGRGGPYQGGPGGQGGPYQGGPGGGMPGGGGGGGFLGTAAAAAAGAIGGGLLMGGIRSALGGQGGGGQGGGKGPMQGALDEPGGRFGGGSAAGGNLSNEAGLNDIGRSKLGAMRDEPKEEEEEETEEEDGEEEDGEIDHDDVHDSYDEDQA